MFIENGAGEALDPEEVPAGDEGDEPEFPAGTKDPLDAIEDETARNLAKAERAKARREARRDVKPEEKKEPVKEPEPLVTSYATKDDLKKLATNEARKMVAPEVNEAWDELVAIPLGGFDPMDSASIAKNMQQRFVLYQQSQASKDDPAADFTKSSVIPSQGGALKEAKPDAAKSLPGFKEPTPPTEWYK